MKGLILSDLHSHPHRAFAYYREGLNSRLHNSVDVMKEVIEASGDCDFALFLGDLWHVAPPDTVAFNLVYDLFAALAEKVPVGMIAGNHDLKSKVYRGDPREIPFLKFCKSKGISILDLYGDQGQMFDGVKVLGLNCRKIEEVREILSKASPCDILVLHQDVKDARLGKFIFPDGITQEDTAKFKWTFVGHIHQPQRISDRFLIPGAPMHLNFGDSGDRGFWILDMEKETLEMVKTSFPKFVTVETPESVREDGNFYRVSMIDKSRREALTLPGSDGAIVEYVKKMKAPEEYGETGRSLASSVSQEVIAPTAHEINKIEIENFVCFEKAEFSVDEGLCLVVGEFEGRQGKSNGAGKTTLFEAISWCLYGLTSKGERGTAIIRRGAPKGSQCSVTTTFESPTGRLVVKRTQSKSGSSLTFTKGDKLVEGDIRKIQKELVDQLGVSYAFFCQMVYFSQESVEFFSSMGDTAKKDILGKLLGLEWYQGAQEIAKMKRDAAKHLVVEFQNHKESLERSIKETEAQIEGLERNIQEWEIKKQDKLTEVQQKIDDTALSISGLSENLTVLRQKIEELSSLEGSLKEAGKKVEECQQRLLEVREALAELRVSEGTFRRSRDKGEEKLKRIESLQDGVRCVVCGAEVTPENKDHCAEPIREELRKIEAELLNVTQDYRSGKLTEIPVETELQEVRERVERLRKEEAALSSLESSRDVQEERLRSLQSLLDSQKTRLEEIGSEVCPLGSHLGGLEEALKSKKHEVEGVLTDIEGTEKKQKTFEFWVSGFGREGIPAVLLDGFCRAFTLEVNEILEQMGIGISVDLTAHTTLKSGEVRERLSYVIKTPTGESSYRLLSGGEKLRVDLTSMLALNRIASRQFAIEDGLFGVLVLDEIFSALDEEGCEVVYELLNKFQARSVFVISHSASLKSLFDHIMEVRRIGNTSIVV